MTLTRAFATSTSARVTKDLGWVPTWKNPCALRRLTSARSSAARLTWTSRLESSSMKYCVFTSWEMSSFCDSSTSLSASALYLATSLAAHVRPKSKRSWEAVTLAEPKSLVADALLGRHVVADARHDQGRILETDVHRLFQSQLASDELLRGGEGADSRGRRQRLARRHGRGRLHRLWRRGGRR